jgi:hypothetical protein
MCEKPNVDNPEKDIFPSLHIELNKFYLIHTEWQKTG